ncbi:MAG: glycine cleavage system aminomethyltransferase GcvT [Thermoanaerobaculia bacterium]
MSHGPLRQTPLLDCHREAGARLVEFAGWSMPVQYGGVLEEHRAVRERAGLFDVSHMGEIRVAGPGAESYLQRLTPNDVQSLVPGRAHYSGLLNERGGYLDDLLVYRMDDEEFLVVVNAANAESDFAWMREHSGDGVTVEDVSSEYALLALQGPRAVDILARLTDDALEGIRYYRFARGHVAGRDAILSRTGYTGEDGFELYVAPEDAPMIWRRLLETGEPEGLVSVGLGARDTLRLEAGMALYGHELDAETTPWEAGLDWVVKLDAGDFIGKQALIEQKEAGVPRRLVGFEIEGRGIAREGHPMLFAGEPVGRVTSGSFSPTFEKALGMAYVASRVADPDAQVEIEVRGRRLPARLVELPIYRRQR